jgi:hypothetical protein
MVPRPVILFLVNVTDRAINSIFSETIETCSVREVSNRKLYFVKAAVNVVY